jgi:hypothetical protein
MSDSQMSPETRKFPVLVLGVGLLVGLIMGYFAGRAHLKYEIQNAFGAVFGGGERSKKAAGTSRALGGLRAYSNAQSIYQTKHKRYGSLQELAESAGLDSLIAQSSKPIGQSYAGYWYDDTFTGTDMKHEYQCVLVPTNPEVGTTIYLTNQTGNIYTKEEPKVPAHGINGKVPQLELDDRTKWSRPDA